MNKNKYLITLWTDWNEYGCVFKKFSIEYETSELNDANRKLDKIVSKAVNEVLKEFPDFALIQAPSDKKPILVDVNRNNKVVRKERRIIGDGSNYSRIYYNFEIIKLPSEAKIDENLFNLENCQQEVKNYFKYIYNQSQKNTLPEKRFIGVKELAKNKSLRSSLSHWLKK